MTLRTLDDLDPAGKRVLLRVDLNVPMEDGLVSDATRIERVVPTIRELSEKGAKVLLLAHFGRPKGERVASMSMKPIVPVLEEALGRPVSFAGDCIGEQAAAMAADMAPGDVMLLENVRFHAGEEANDADFARQMGELGDTYVNDAFSAAHRAHASTEGARAICCRPMRDAHDGGRVARRWRSGTRPTLKTARHGRGRRGEGVDQA